MKPILGGERPLIRIPQSFFTHFRPRLFWVILSSRRAVLGNFPFPFYPILPKATLGNFAIVAGFWSLVIWIADKCELFDAYYLLITTQYFLPISAQGYFG